MNIYIVNYVNIDCSTGELDFHQTKVFAKEEDATAWIARDFANIKDEIVGQDGGTQNIIEMDLGDLSAELVYGDTENDERHRLHKWWVA